MSKQLVTFNARYSPELIEQATQTFRDFRFRRYGPLYIGACLVNVTGLATAVWLDPVLNPILLASLVLMVICGPAWLLYQYFFAPSRQAAKLKQLLQSARQISIDSQTLWVTTEGREIALPFARMKAVVETDALFMLVLSPFAFLFVPGSGLPAEAYSVLHEKAQSSARGHKGRRG